jgi:hypothetical protein
LSLHVLPLVAMYKSTSAARCAVAVGATTPTRTLRLHPDTAYVTDGNVDHHDGCTDK